MGRIGSNIFCRNVHSGKTQGQGLGYIVSYYTSPIPYITPMPWSRAVWISHYLWWLFDTRNEIRGGSRIPCRRGAATTLHGGSATIRFCENFQKMHEFEKILGHGGGGRGIDAHRGRIWIRQGSVVLNVWLIGNLWKLVSFPQFWITSNMRPRSTRKTYRYKAPEWTLFQRKWFLQSTLL